MRQVKAECCIKRKNPTVLKHMYVRSCCLHDLFCGYFAELRTASFIIILDEKIAAFNFVTLRKKKYSCFKFHCLSKQILGIKKT